MQLNDVLRMFLQAITQHIPTSVAWVPLVSLVVVGLFGLVLLLKGARLARGMIALFLLCAGGLGASHLTPWLGTPLWPTVGCGALAGFLLGFALFRLWLGVLVGGCVVAGSVSVYAAQVLRPYLEKFTTGNYDSENQLVTLMPAGSVVGAATTPSQHLGELWTYLATQVPNFQANFTTLIIASAVVGVAIGIFLPRTARALWAATAGTATLFAASVTFLQGYLPATLAWLASLGEWSWAIPGVIWLASFMCNLRDCRPRRTVVADDAVPVAKGKRINVVTA